MNLAPEKMKIEKGPAFKRIFTFDFETHPFRPGCMLPPVVCLQWAYDNDAPVITRAREDFKPSDAVPTILAEALLDDDVLMVGHGVAFDLGCICTNWPELTEYVFAKLDKGLVADTVTREKLIRIATGEMSTDPSAGAKKQGKFNMAEVVKRRFFTDIEESKHGAESWRLRYPELEDVPVPQWPLAARKYAEDDVLWTRKIFLAQEADPAGYNEAPPEGLCRPGWGITDEAAQTRASFAFKLLEAWGNVTDPETVHALLVDTHAQVEKANDILRAQGVLKAGKVKGVVNWSKNMAEIKKRVVAILGDATPKTDSGGISTAGDTLDKCLAAQDAITFATHVVPTGEKEREEFLRQFRDPALQALVDVNEAADTQSKWAQVLDQGTQSTIHANYNPLAETGRTTCYKPNLQNPKRKGGVRECFVPRPGYYFAFADYNTLELLALAQTCLDLFGYSKMADALRGEQNDLHLQVASQFLHKSYEWCKANKKSKEVKDARQMAKPFNFGLPGGCGYDAFADFAWASYGYRIHEDEDEARKEFKRMKFQVYYGTFPEMKDYHKLMGQLCAGGNATIAQIPTGRVRGDCKFTVASNTFFQGRAADGAKLAFYEVVKECYTGYGKFWPEATMPRKSPLYGSRPVFFLHDEIGLEVPISRAEGAANRLTAVMERAMLEMIPDIPAQAPPVLGRCWYKGQDPVFVDGHLVPGKPVERADGGVDWVPDL